MKKYGQLAKDIFCSENNLLREKDIIKVVGPQPFQSGFLIGHRDSRLLKDETANLFVRFPHRSVQEFLIAFNIVLTANDGMPPINEEDPYLILYPLIFQFCCWLLFRGDKYVPLHNRDSIVTALEEVTAKCIDNVEIDIGELPSIFKALDLKHFVETNDKYVLNFFMNIFSRCHRVNHLVLESFCPPNWIASTVQPLVHGLKSITMQNFRYFDKVPLHSTSLSANEHEKVTIIVNDHSEFLTMWHIIAGHFKHFDKKLCLYICCGNIRRKWMCLQFCMKRISELYIENSSAFKVPQVKVQIRNEINNLSISYLLICVRDLKIGEQFLTKISKAVKTGYLPKLSSP